MKPVEFALSFSGIRALVPEGGAPTPEQWEKILELHAAVIAKLAAEKLLDEVEEEIIATEYKRREHELESKHQRAVQEMERIRQQWQMDQNMKFPVRVPIQPYHGIGHGVSTTGPIWSGASGTATVTAPTSAG